MDNNTIPAQLTPDNTTQEQYTGEFMRQHRLTLDTIYDMSVHYNQTVHEYTTSMREYMGSNNYSSTVISQYNHNIQGFNTNMRELIRSLQTSQATTARSLQQPRFGRSSNPPRSTRAPTARFPPTQHLRTESAPPMPAATSPIRSPTTVADNMWLFTYLLQPTEQDTSPLTAEEISSATRTYGYTAELSVDLSGNQCPISLDHFQVGDVICKINGCGHAFKRRALMQWFRRSSSCPVCRYNVRQPVNNTDPVNQPETTGETDLSQSLNQLIRTWLEGAINSNSNTNMYQFDISTNIINNAGRTEEASIPDNNSTIENDDNEDINDDLSVD
jgi:hypothetical protein